MAFHISLALSLVTLAVLYQLYRGYIAGCVCTNRVRLDGKTVIITGANTGIGKETALDLVKRGARVIMACRNLKKGEMALKDIVKETSSSKVFLKHLDLGSLTSVRKFAEDINKSERQLDVLINNAGVAFVEQFLKTEDGFEMTMGVNHFGHFLLTNLLLDLLKTSSPSRIVVVSSIAHQMMTTEMRFDNLNSEMFYNKYDCYGQSKLANIMFTRELAKRLEGSNVTVNSLRPGLSATQLGRHQGFFLNYIVSPVLFMFVKSSKEGAQTTVHLAVSEDVEGLTGLYFSDCKPKEPSKAAQDDEAAEKLWEVSAALVGLNDTI